ncbi:SpoIIE family protein phosphatase [Streptomyces sp. NPDC004232]|uniref:SpoIIE family protein phosphatase n=1 Tax=Streptomyces sp. NPDC004232 TaxID=3154454 RepID=UPI001DADAC28|nr:serine/threonine-protein phosphatase [Streptomyces sp. tea 10]
MTGTALGKRFAFFLGDVCGKGAQTAAVTCLNRCTLRAAALHDPDHVSGLSTLNKVLHERYAGRGDRATARRSSVRSNPAPSPVRSSYTFPRGGHPPAVVLRADGTAGFLPSASFATATTAPARATPFSGGGDQAVSVEPAGQVPSESGEDRALRRGQPGAAPELSAQYRVLMAQRE